ncbi:class I SAM-dependent methyltransferase [Herbidospora cretacea]|uniref:class I SAM-dependent methyltransferase n=1 Tax=Herbidospora cretacea TaxID=28444 RepID=UPI0009DD552F|nr:class I SAM-dependent methyltransferase [Herbidospora cretacea]
MGVPGRLAMAVDALDLRPDAWVLEIGCGRGGAARLVVERLTTGRYLGVDRSETAIRFAREKVPGAGFRCEALERLSVEGEFDVIFAVNVNHFWVRDPAAEMERLVALLAPGGSLTLFYETPGERAAELGGRLSEMFARHGLRPEVSVLGPKVFAVAGQSPRASQTSHR